MKQLRCSQILLLAMTTRAESNQQLVRRLLGVIISKPDDVPNLSNQELDMALRLTRRVRLLGRLGSKLQATGSLEKLPQPAIDQLHSGLAMADARSRLARWELDRIAWAMGSDVSTPLVAMKGCTYLLLDLPNAAGRIFADVDLMTMEEDLESVEAVLNRKGWISTKLTPYDQNYYRKWTHELPPLVHEEREVEIDLHHNIMPRTARLHPSAEMLLARSRQLPESRYRVLADEDIVLHAMTHLMFDGDLADKLRDLIDVCDLLEHFSGRNADFWQRFVDRAEALDLTRPAYYSIRYACRLLELPVPGSVHEKVDRWAPMRAVVWLMDRLAPRALFPQHPEHPSKVTEFCRLLLYIRSHWIRMPPWLLAYHLSYKFFATRLVRRQR